MSKFLKISILVYTHYMLIYKYLTYLYMCGCITYDMWVWTYVKTMYVHIFIWKYIVNIFTWITVLVKGFNSIFKRVSGRYLYIKCTWILYHFFLYSSLLWQILQEEFPAVDIYNFIGVSSRSGQRARGSLKP